MMTQGFTQSCELSLMPVMREVREECHVCCCVCSENDVTRSMSVET